MIARPPALNAPLRKPWPRHVRSAIVHAVSMAHVAFTATQARAENHFDERIRQRAEIECLRTLIELLVEELRIKDARRERMENNRWRTSRNTISTRSSCSARPTQSEPR